MNAKDLKHLSRDYTFLILHIRKHFLVLVFVSFFFFLLMFLLLSRCLDHLLRFFKIRSGNATGVLVSDKHYMNLVFLRVLKSQEYVQELVTA